MVRPNYLLFSYLAWLWENMFSKTCFIWVKVWIITVSWHLEYQPKHEQNIIAKWLIRRISNLFRLLFPCTFDRIQEKYYGIIDNIVCGFGMISNWTVECFIKSNCGIDSDTDFDEIKFPWNTCIACKPP